MARATFSNTASSKTEQGDTARLNIVQILRGSGRFWEELSDLPVRSTGELSTAEPDLSTRQEYSVTPSRSAELEDDAAEPSRSGVIVAMKNEDVRHTVNEHTNKSGLDSVEKRASSHFSSIGPNSGEVRLMRVRRRCYQNQQCPVQP